MTLTEWKPIAERIGRLWHPPMEPAIAEEYFAVLDEFPAVVVDKALTLAAKQPRSFRPDVGTLYTTAEALVRQLREALPPADVDPLPADERAAVLDEIKARQTAEHRRRHEAVVGLLRTTGYRIPLPVLSVMMPTSKFSADEFDAALERHRGRALSARRSA